MDHLYLTIKYASSLGWKLLYQEIDLVLKKEDLLQLRSPSNDFLLDLGWYGNNQEGKYQLYIYKPDFLGQKLVEISSTDCLEISVQMRKLLKQYS